MGARLAPPASCRVTQAVSSFLGRIVFKKTIGSSGEVDWDIGYEAGSVDS